MPWRSSFWHPPPPPTPCETISSSLTDVCLWLSLAAAAEVAERRWSIWAGNWYQGCCRDKNMSTVPLQLFQHFTPIHYFASTLGLPFPVHLAVGWMKSMSVLHGQVQWVSEDGVKRGGAFGRKTGVSAQGKDVMLQSSSELYISGIWLQILLYFCPFLAF